MLNISSQLVKIDLLYVYTQGKSMLHCCCLHMCCVQVRQKDDDQMLQCWWVHTVNLSKLYAGYWSLVCLTFILKQWYLWYITTIDVSTDCSQIPTSKSSKHTLKVLWITCKWIRKVAQRDILQWNEQYCTYHVLCTLRTHNAYIRIRLLNWNISPQSWRLRVVYISSCIYN